MIEHLSAERLPQHQFGETTVRLLNMAGVECLPAPPDMSLNNLGQYDHIIFDIDGVARPYNGQVSDEVRDWYAQVTDRVSFVSLNPKLRGIMTFLGAPAYVSERSYPVAGKVPLMRLAMKRAGAHPEHTLAIGDGLTDVLSARLAGIGHIGLVHSRGGAHPAQEVVTNILYSRALRTADRIRRQRSSPHTYKY